MKLKIVAIVTSVFLLLIIMDILTYVPYIDFDRLYAEVEIERWAHTIMAQKGTGRTCVHADLTAVNSAFESMGGKKLDKDPDIFLQNVQCWKEMHLVDMRYYSDYNVVSGVYRCEKDDMIQELQLAIYLEPKIVDYDDWCEVGTLKKEWNIPAGKATMFSLP